MKAVVIHQAMDLRVEERETPSSAVAYADQIYIITNTAASAPFG
jgi:hypothetical protein